MSFWNTNCPNSNSLCITSVQKNPIYHILCVLSISSIILLFSSSWNSSGLFDKLQARFSNLMNKLCQLWPYFVSRWSHFQLGLIFAFYFEYWVWPIKHPCLMIQLKVVAPFGIITQYERKTATGNKQISRKEQCHSEKERQVMETRTSGLLVSFIDADKMKMVCIWCNGGSDMN